MDTIFALASAPGAAGVAVVRISGPRAFSAAQSLVGDLPDARRAGLRIVRGSDGAMIDEALVLVFGQGASFTGEDVVELQLHGSTAVVSAVLRELSEETGETTHLSLLQGDQLASLSHAYAPQHATKVMMEDAEVLTFHGTASGLAVLGFAEPGFAERVLNGPLEARTAHTQTDPAAIRALIADVRASGMAQSVGGYEAEVHSHAVPIFGPDRAVIGALAVAAPTSRMSEAQKQAIPEALRAAGLALTQRIGGVCPPEYPT